MSTVRRTLKRLRNTLRLFPLLPGKGKSKSFPLRSVPGTRSPMTPMQEFSLRHSAAAVSIANPQRGSTRWNALPRTILRGAACRPAAPDGAATCVTTRMGSTRLGSPETGKFLAPKSTRDYPVCQDLFKYLRIAHNMTRMDFGTCRQFSRISGENFQDVRGTK